MQDIGRFDFVLCPSPAGMFMGFPEPNTELYIKKKAPAPWQTQGFYYVIGDGMHNKASSVLVELGIPLFGMIYVIISYKVGPPR